MNSGNIGFHTIMCIIIQLTMAAHFIYTNTKIDALQTALDQIVEARP